jgi:glutathione synthase
MNFLIIGDPFETLNPKTDTGLAIARDSMARGHAAFWSTLEDVSLAGVRVEARARAVIECRRGCLPKIAETVGFRQIDSFDVVWIRKDPPVDWKYVSLCWLLSMEEKETVIVNRPSLLLEYHEKMIPFRALREGYLRDSEVMSTHLVTGRHSRPPKAGANAEWITKPWLGHGGRGIEKWESLERFLSTELGDFDENEAYLMLQRFYPEVRETGDRRLFYIGGEYVGGFIRIPAAGGIKANLASGGTAVLKEITPKELDTAKRLGEYLKSIGIVLAGADMIDGRITEVNITAPTGFETYFDLCGERLVERLVDFVEQVAS